MVTERRRRNLNHLSHTDVRRAAASWQQQHTRTLCPPGQSPHGAYAAWFAKTCFERERA